MIHDDQIPVAPEPPRVQHVPGEVGVDVRPFAGVDVYPVPERLRSEARVHACAILLDHAPFRGPHQPAPHRSQSHARRRTLAGCYFRRLRRGRGNLRDPAPLLEIPNERFESPGGFAQLTDHAVVVDPLVLDSSQDPPSLACFPVGLGPLTLDLAPEGRHLLAPGLQSVLPVRQTLRSNTILSNHSGVHRGERGQMAQADGLRDRVVARQKHGEGAALDLEPVHGPQALGEGIFLAGPLTLETDDVALKLAHLRLGALDPPVEDRHLLALLAQSPVDRLEVGEESHLALPRVRGLGTLFLEPLLRLLERMLLVAEVGAVLLLLPHRGQGEGELEQRAEGDPEGAGHATTRPRARRPPNPPNTAPPAMSKRICGTER